MCTINNYLSLFGTMRSLHDVPQLKAILMEETKNVTADLERYVDFRTLSSDALLANHPGYNNAIYETGDYISNQIDVEADRYYEKPRIFFHSGVIWKKISPLSAKCLSQVFGNTIKLRKHIIPLLSVLLSN